MINFKIMSLFFIMVHGFAIPEFAGDSANSIKSPLRILRRLQLFGAAKEAQESAADLFGSNAGWNQQVDSTAPKSFLRNMLLLKNT